MSSYRIDEHNLKGSSRPTYAVLHGLDTARKRALRANSGSNIHDWWLDVAIRQFDLQIKKINTSL